MFGVKELTYVLDWGNRVYEKKEVIHYVPPLDTTIHDKNVTILSSKSYRHSRTLFPSDN